MVTGATTSDIALYSLRKLLPLLTNFSVDVMNQLKVYLYSPEVDEDSQVSCKLDLKSKLTVLHFLAKGLEIESEQTQIITIANTLLRSILTNLDQSQPSFQDIVVTDAFLKDFFKLFGVWVDCRERILVMNVDLSSVLLLFLKAIKALSTQGSMGKKRIEIMCDLFVPIALPLITGARDMEAAIINVIRSSILTEMYALEVVSVEIDQGAPRPSNNKKRKRNIEDKADGGGSNIAAKQNGLSFCEQVIDKIAYHFWRDDVVSGAMKTCFIQEIIGIFNERSQSIAANDVVSARSLVIASSSETGAKSSKYQQQVDESVASRRHIIRVLHFGLLVIDRLTCPSKYGAFECFDSRCGQLKAGVMEIVLLGLQGKSLPNHASLEKYNILVQRLYTDTLAGLREISLTSTKDPLSSYSDANLQSTVAYSATLLGHLHTVDHRLLLSHIKSVIHLLYSTTWCPNATCAHSLIQLHSSTWLLYTDLRSQDALLDLFFAIAKKQTIQGTAQYQGHQKSAADVLMEDYSSVEVVIDALRKLPEAKWRQVWEKLFQSLQTEEATGDLTTVHIYACFVTFRAYQETSRKQTTVQVGDKQVQSAHQSEEASHIFHITGLLQRLHGGINEILVEHDATKRNSIVVKSSLKQHLRCLCAIINHIVHAYASSFDLLTSNELDKFIIEGFSAALNDLGDVLNKTPALFPLLPDYLIAINMLQVFARNRSAKLASCNYGSVKTSTPFALWTLNLKSDKTANEENLDVEEVNSLSLRRFHAFLQALLIDDSLSQSQHQNILHGTLVQGLEAFVFSRFSAQTQQSITSNDAISDSCQRIDAVLTSATYLDLPWVAPALLAACAEVLTRCLSSRTNLGSTSSSSANYDMRHVLVSVVVDIVRHIHPVRLTTDLCRSGRDSLLQALFQYALWEVEPESQETGMQVARDAFAAVWQLLAQLLQATWTSTEASSEALQRMVTELDLGMFIENTYLAIFQDYTSHHLSTTRTSDLVGNVERALCNLLCLNLRCHDGDRDSASGVDIIVDAMYCLQMNLCSGVHADLVHSRAQREAMLQSALHLSLRVYRTLLSNQGNDSIGKNRYQVLVRKIATSCLVRLRDAYPVILLRDRDETALGAYLGCLAEHLRCLCQFTMVNSRAFEDEHDDAALNGKGKEDTSSKRANRLVTFAHQAFTRIGHILFSTAASGDRATALESSQGWLMLLDVLVAQPLPQSSRLFTTSRRGKARYDLDRNANRWQTCLLIAADIVVTQSCLRPPTSLSPSPSLSSSTLLEKSAVVGWLANALVHLFQREIASEGFRRVTGTTARPNTLSLSALTTCFLGAFRQRILLTSTSSAASSASTTERMVLLTLLTGHLLRALASIPPASSSSARTEDAGKDVHYQVVLAETILILREQYLGDLQSTLMLMLQVSAGQEPGSLFNTVAEEVACTQRLCLQQLQSTSSALDHKDEAVKLSARKAKEATTQPLTRESEAQMDVADEDDEHVDLDENEDESDDDSKGEDMEESLESDMEEGEEEEEEDEDSLDDDSLEDARQFTGRQRQQTPSADVHSTNWSMSLITRWATALPGIVLELSTLAQRHVHHTPQTTHSSQHHSLQQQLVQRTQRLLILLLHDFFVFVKRRVAGPAAQQLVLVTRSICLLTQIAQTRETCQLLARLLALFPTITAAQKHLAELFGAVVHACASPLLLTNPAISSSGNSANHSSALAPSVAEIGMSRVARELLQPGLFAVYEKLSSKERQRCFAQLDSSARDLLHELNDEYFRNYRFQGN